MARERDMTERSFWDTEKGDMTLSLKKGIVSPFSGHVPLFRRPPGTRPVGSPVGQADGSPSGLS